MNPDYEKILKRQLRKCNIQIEDQPSDIKALLSQVDSSYKLYKKEMQLLNRAMELSSKEILDKNLELKKAAELSREFSYIAAHNLKEPLRTISAFSNLLGKNLTEDHSKEQEYIGLITEACKTMYSYLTDLTNYLVIEEFKSENTIQEDLNIVLSRCTKSMHQLISENNATIKSQTLPKIKSFPSAFDQLFQNLISNAIKFKSDKNPIIKIECEKRQNQLVVSFMDNGIGIDPQYAKKVFEIYTRLDRSKQGTGMGLPICKKILEYHGGSIEVDTHYHTGTKMDVFLPESMIENNQ